MKRPGFTMIELLIYIAITSIALVVISNFFSDTTANAARARQSQELQKTASFIFSRLSQEIRSAPSVTVDNSALPDVTVRAGSDTFVYSQSGKTFTLNNQPLNSANVSIDSLTASTMGLGANVTLGLSTKNVTPSQTLQFSTTLFPHRILYQ